METDYEKFAISADGVLTFASPPDFDSPGDKDERQRLQGDKWWPTR